MCLFHYQLYMTQTNIIIQLCIATPTSTCSDNRYLLIKVTKSVMNNLT